VHQAGGARPGRQMAPRFRDPEFTAEDLAVAEHLGNPSCPKFPRKPDVPRKWGRWDWCAAWDRTRLRCTRPRTAPARPHAPAEPDRVAGRPPGLRDTIYGTRSGWPHRHRPRPFGLSSAHLARTAHSQAIPSVFLEAEPGEERICRGTGFVDVTTKIWMSLR
jgi:hypothetical protein